MKYILHRLLVFSVVAALSISFTYAQVGIGTDDPNPRAVLELKSPTGNQGFLVPRVATDKRLAMSLTSEDKGMLVFDSNINKFYYWSGTAWVVIDDSVGTDNQTLSFTPSTGTLVISGGNSISINGVPAGGDLTGTYPNPTLAANSITGAEITDGTIATVDLANSSVTAAKLANTAVTAGTYGSATQVPQLVVDAQGRITGVTLMTITGTLPGGAAGGDLTGAYPNPTLVANSVASVEITDGSITSADITDLTIATADLANGAVTDAKIATVAPSKITAGGATGGQVLKWSGTAWAPQADNTGTGTVTSITAGTGLSGGTITATGTISLPNTGTAGSYGSATQVPVFTTDAQGRVTAVTNTTITGIVPSGAAGGNLTGTYPNPTIAATAGTNIVSAVNDASTTGTIGTNRLNAAVVLDSEAPAAGDISGSFTGGLQIGANAVTSAEIAPGTVGTTDLADASVTALKLATTGVTAAMYGSATTVPQITVDAQGRITAATSTTVTGVTPGGTANGDLSGSYPDPTVDGLQGRAVLNTAPSNGQVLKWSTLSNAWVPSTDATGGGGVGGGGSTDQVAIWSSATDVGAKSTLVFDTKNDRLGVNTANPLGTLHVMGSQFVNHVQVLDDYTIKPTDYSILVPNTAKPVVIDLPVIAPNNVGRVLIFRTMNSANVTLVAASGPKDEIDTIGASYPMRNDGEQYKSLILIATQFSGQDRWMIVGGVIK